MAERSVQLGDLDAVGAAHGGGCPLLVQDLTGRWGTDDFGISAQGTRYFRTPGFASIGVACALRGESARLE